MLSRAGRREAGGTVPLSSARAPSAPLAGMAHPNPLRTPTLKPNGPVSPIRDRGRPMRTTSIISTLLALGLTASAAAQIASVAPGYEAIPITGLPSTPTGAVAGDAVDTDAFYVTFGGFESEFVYRLTLDPTAFELVADGTSNIANGLADGNDVLDNNFGALGLVSLPDGTLYANDSDGGSAATGAASEAVLFFQDGNADGDFRDVVTGTPEARFYTAPIATNAANYTGAGIAASGAGVLFSATSDGGGNGEVLRIAPGGPPTQTVFFPGLTFGSGVGVKSNDAVIVGDTDFAAVNRVLRLIDLDADNIASTAGEVMTITSTIDPPNSLSLSSAADGERIVVSTNGATPAVVILDEGTGSTEPLVVFDDDQFATGLAFDRTNRSFASGIANGETLLVTTLSLTDFETRLFLVRPVPSASVDGWERY